MRLMTIREIPREDLAESLRLDVAQLDDLIAGHLRINEALATALAYQLGSSPRLWLARDKTYIRDLTRIGEAKCNDIASWTKLMPVASMKKYGWVPKTAKGKELASELLRFFGCSNLQEWGKQYSSGVGEVAFKTSLAFEADAMSTLVWLRAGEQKADELSLPKFDRKAFADCLPTLKKLSAFKHPKIFFARLETACHAAGVALTSARAPEGCRASGASWVASSGNPVIHLSFRHLSEDHFWFTFFHEAAHVVLHGRNHIDADSSNTASLSSPAQEQEADNFAQETLLPQALLDQLMRGQINPHKVISAAREADVTAGIVVGQLEKAKAIPHGKLSFLKHRYRWGESATLPEIYQPRKYS